MASEDDEMEAFYGHEKTEADFQADEEEKIRVAEEEYDNESEEG